MQKARTPGAGKARFTFDDLSGMQLRIDNEGNSGQPARSASSFSAFQDDSGASNLGSVRKREVYFLHAQTLSKRCGTSVQTKKWSARAKPQHLDVMPAAGVAHASANGLEESLFGSEAHGQRGNGINQIEAILQFRSRKKTYQATLAVLLVKTAHAWNRNQVQTGTQYH
jgi:hypothetical protein